MKNIFHFSVLAIIVVFMASLSTNAHAENSGNPKILEILKEHDIEIQENQLAIISEILENEEIDARRFETIRDILKKIPEGECGNAWSKKIPALQRFKVVLDGKGVLDLETCLVWERSPSDETMEWNSAIFRCFRREVAGRRGWRLPTIEELTSLIDTVIISPALPTGHPFDSQAVGSKMYWSSTTNAFKPTSAWYMSTYDGVPNLEFKTFQSGRAWCVRGGQGHDAN